MPQQVNFAAWMGGLGRSPEWGAAQMGAASGPLLIAADRNSVTQLHRVELGHKGSCIGAEGFEPPVFWSQTRRPTRLGHAPMLLVGRAP